MAFQYERLPDKTWIRLIKIQEELHDGQLACSLQQFSSDTCPVYKALSYLWGDPTPKHTVFVNGTSRLIHSNLFLYLDQAWQSRETAYLWIDSICLDQDNHAEKNEQVPLMGNTYASAELVIAWIGSDRAGMDMLTFFGRGWSPPHARQSYKDEDDLALFLRITLNLGTLKGGAVKHLQRLLKTESFWNRVWIFQEIICSKDCLVVCGPISVQWTDVVQNARNTVYGMTDVRSGGLWENLQFFVLADLRERLRRGDTLTLRELCRKLQNRQSGRNIDLVYGLLGLAQRFDPGFDPQTLDVNYEKPPGHVFWDIVIATWETCWKSGDQQFLTTRSDSLYSLAADFGLIHEQGIDCSLSELRSFAEASTTRKDRQQIAHTALQTIREVQCGITFPKGSNMQRRLYIQVSVKELLSHAHIHLPPMNSQPIQLVCGRIIGLSTLVFSNNALLKAGDAQFLEFERTPLVCAAHLPDKVLARRVPLNEQRLSDPIKSSEPICSRGSPLNDCDHSFEVLEWPELGLDLQLTRHLDTEGPPPVFLYHLDVFCTFCDSHL